MFHGRDPGMTENDLSTPLVQYSIDTNVRTGRIYSVFIYPSSYIQMFSVFTDGAATRDDRAPMFRTYTLDEIAVQFILIRIDRYSRSAILTVVAVGTSYYFAFEVQVYSKAHSDDK